jgi:hypothetical protein
MDFGVTDKLLVRYSALVTYKKKEFERNGVVHQLIVHFKKTYNSGEKYCKTSSLNVVQQWNDSG